jgi:DNA polymerase III sliding clamp (beta) subunit (PCNA family)
MYNKLNLAVGKIASKSSIKPELQAIAFCGNRTIATDSFRLLEISAPGEKHEPILLNAKQLKSNMKMPTDDYLSVEEIKTQSATVPIESRFPDVDEIIEPAFKREDDLVIKVNGKLLAELATLLAGMNKFGQVTLRIPQKPYSPIAMYAETKEKTEGKQIGRALLMPMNK